MITPKKVRLILLTPALLAIIILSGCLDKKSKQINSKKNTEKSYCVGDKCCISDESKK